MIRLEKDFIGEREIAGDALYGIHSVRASENFPDKTPFPEEWYRAVGTVKLAVYQTIEKFYQAVQNKHGSRNILIKKIEPKVLRALLDAATEVTEGKHREHFIVPAISGGAGTSINMNVNEIIANAALIKLGRNPGEYSVVDPVEDANKYQSTNDVIPTSLKVAAIRLLELLEESINNLRMKIEGIEKETRNSLRTAYTQMQEAVPSSYGRLFSTYNEALSRDWWRVSKCFERIKVVNIGGSAVGTALTVPRFLVMETLKTLQKLTGLPITRPENLADATNNLDSLVEVHAILKSHAVNLEKMVSDIRLLSSDLTRKEIEIPERQAGSSVMPGKVNPVIPEFVISAAHKVYANDALVTSLSAQGCLDLNAYMPTIGNALIESINLLIASDISLLNNMITGLRLNEEKALNKLYHSPSVTTALLPMIGYHAATHLALEMKVSGSDIFQANEKLKLMDKEKLKDFMKPSYLLKEGFTLDDLMSFEDKEE